ncbi:MAG: hypothetical protein AB1508_02515 [Pseudomonadota bacterium]
MNKIKSHVAQHKSGDLAKASGVHRNRAFRFATFSENGFRAALSGARQPPQRAQIFTPVLI